MTVQFGEHRGQKTLLKQITSQLSNLKDKLVPSFKKNTEGNPHGKVRL